MAQKKAIRSKASHGDAALAGTSRGGEPFVAKTPEEAKAAFEAAGRTVAEFCREHGLRYSTTYQVLTGAKKGKRGEAHRAAVLLGLKEGVA